MLELVREREIQYSAYCKLIAQAEENYKYLRELYGNEMPWDKLLLKAKMDRVITENERQWIKEYLGK